MSSVTPGPVVLGRARKAPELSSAPPWPPQLWPPQLPLSYKLNPFLPKLGLGPGVYHSNIKANCYKGSPQALKEAGSVLATVNRSHQFNRQKDTYQGPKIYLTFSMSETFSVCFFLCFKKVGIILWIHNRLSKV